MNSYWISFVSGHANAGCCIVDAESPEMALEKTNVLNINPGGEAMIFHIRPDSIDLALWEKNRIISPEELRNSGYKKTGEVRHEIRRKIENNEHVTIVCEGCNK